MFDDVKNMSTQEIENQLSAIELYEREIDKVTIESMLQKQIDTSFLTAMKCTMTPNGELFRTDKRGFLPTMLDDMYVGRKEFKKKSIEAKKQLEGETNKSRRLDIEKVVARFNNLQLAKKVSLNSCYGATGSKYFRFYDIRMAVAVTSSGQLSTRWIEKKINEFMNKIMETEGVDYIIASDTDSIYLNLGPLVKRAYTKTTWKNKNQVIDFMDKVCEQKISPFIKKSFQELADYMHAYEQKMNMKRESLSDKGIWTAKKRYILNVYDMEGVRYKEPEIKVTGLEMIKSSTPAAVRESMKKIIKVILNDTEADAQEFIRKTKADFKALPPEDISFPRGVNGIRKYSDAADLYKSGTPIHVRGAILYNDFLKRHDLLKKYPTIKEGEKIKYTYLKMPNTLKENVISFPDRIPKEMKLEEFVDYEAQFNLTFLEPIKVILNCMDWQAEKRSTLEDFFS